MIIKAASRPFFLFALCFFPALVSAAAKPPPLTYKVTLTGTHDIDWTYTLKEDSTPGGGHLAQTLQEGTEFVDYDSIKPATMIFKNKSGKGLVGSIKGSGITKFPQIRADITNGNVTNYTCSGLCPPAPDLSVYGAGCGHSSDIANVKVTYEAGTLAIQSMNFSDLPGIGGQTLPPGFDPSIYQLPIGTLFPQSCGPSFPPNNPAQDLVDYRYPFLLPTSSNILPGKPSSAVDKKLKNLKLGKTLTVKFDLSVSPAKTFIDSGSGYIYSGATNVGWTVKLKRVS